MPDITGDGINDYDITPSGSSVTIGGVTFTDAVNTGSGTGNYNTFLAISDNDGVEEGFNSDDTPPIDDSNENIDHAKTHTVKLSSLVIVTINGVQYYEFRVDLNEANSDPNAQISLDQFKLYTSTNGGIVDTTTLFSQNLIYDMDSGGNVSVLLSDAESSGSGTDDYAILVPVSEFDGLDPTTTYVYLYTQMGAAGANWNATATFEEWNLQNGVALTGTKFEDANNNGTKDVGEGPVAGVTIFIDANQNGAFDAGERSTVTDANGNYTFFGVATGQTVWIDEVVPAGATQTTGDHEVVVIADGATPGSTVVVDPIGNFIPHPAMDVTKSVVSVTNGDDNGTPLDLTDDRVDGADNVINYSITIANTGNVALTGVTVTDEVEAYGAVNATYVSGDGNTNNILDVGEIWTYSASYDVTQDDIDNNGGGNGTIDNVAIGDTNETDPDQDDASVPIVRNPAIDVTKSVVSVTNGDDNGTPLDLTDDRVDGADNVINYSITIANIGNVTLTGVTVTDEVEGYGAVNATYVSGDGNTNNILDVGEIWTYSASYDVTQDDIDNNGGGDGTIDNVAIGDTNETDPDQDDASVPIVQNPLIDIEKYVSVDGGVTYADADLVTGPQALLSGDVYFKITLENTGNQTLTGIAITDLLHNYGDNSNSPIDLTGFTLVESDGINDGVLAPGATAELIYTAPFAAGQHTNVSSVTTDQGATDSDAANYFGLVNEGPGVRTPGFWQNMNNGGQFWDGIVGNEKNAGQDCFADGELLYAVDSNNNGSIGAGDVAGLLIGDYNKNGLTDGDEDTLFVSYTDARTLINASNKQLNASTGDGRFMLGRDMVASWLNYLAGNNVGDASDTESPHHYLDDSVDWMQIFSGTLSGGTSETFDTLKLSGGAIKTNTAIWNVPQSGIDHSASQMHSALDYYNNTGQTEPGGTIYAHDCDDQAFVFALHSISLI